MALHFYELPIKKIVQETAECIVISFDLNSENKNIFSFTQGQNVTIKAFINSEEIRRSYSICNAMYENELTIAIKKVPNGVFSNYANNNLKVGESLSVMPPIGKFFTELNKNNSKNYVAFACGSGITPILSIIKTTLYAEVNSNFTLVYSNKNKANIIFFEALEALKNKYMQRLNLIYLLSREQTEVELFNGRINEEKLETLSKVINYKKSDEYFICGPEEMILTTNNYLQKIGINKKQIHFELFGVANKMNNNTSQNNIESDNTKSNIEIKLDGRSFNFVLGTNDINILDAALKQGADLPYACKGGVCCTCKAKLLSGTVSMQVNYGLEEEEIEKGYILTCQAHPTSSNVSINFDVK